MDIDITDYQIGILTGLLVSARNEADREGRNGPWVDEVTTILGRINQSTHQATWLVNPTGGEAFGTKVTMWSDSWGNRHAMIISAPKPKAQRERFDPAEWGIVIKGGGMTFVGADRLTLGWHPDATDC